MGDSWTVKRACHFLACFLSLLPLCCLPWPMPATSLAPRVVCAIPTLVTSATRCVLAATANFGAAARPPAPPATLLQQRASVPPRGHQRRLRPYCSCRCARVPLRGRRRQSVASQHAVPAAGDD